VSRRHLARAALEGIAFEIHDLAQAMAQDIGKPVPMFRVDGGAFRQPPADAIPGRPAADAIERAHMIETTALGAAFLAGLGTGMWDGLKGAAQRLAPRQAVQAEDGRRTFAQRTLRGGSPR